MPKYHVQILQTGKHSSRMCTARFGGHYWMSVLVGVGVGVLGSMPTPGIPVPMCTHPYPWYTHSPWYTSLPPPVYPPLRRDLVPGISTSPEGTWDQAHPHSCGQKFTCENITFPNNYHPSTKLWEGNVFSHVCLSMGGPM